ncbi:unnamed protein product [Psylliodes chrysocephalus]|uniref:Uncharacterized protein n=1 Tax=Psylliodes chrysocephalus TaxID=3402493 RepID=A0A9P0G730_9CUCU|nr:unnamed protein product [Psylliodes chrysocephala]
MTTPDQESALNFNQTQYQNVQSPLDVSYAHSINTIASLRDYIISEDFLAGQRLNGRMSNVRRFFCLFVTFDFLFTSLMWIICVMLNGEYIIKALTEQVIHYNIHTSLFDIVLVSFCRFVILILFYAVIYVNHWIIISISTAATCGFLITKVLYFDWPHSSQPVFEVLLVLVSFILAWGEAWFLDFRVIPQETYANRYIVAGENERTPLIRSYVQGLPSMYTESVGNFYSPQGSPEGSLHRYQPNELYPRYIVPLRLSRQEEELYKDVANKTLIEAWELFQMNDWILQKVHQNDSVYSRIGSNKKKIFKLQADIETSPRYLLDELYYREQEFPKWNSAVKESHKVHSFDECTDITYTISKDSAGGLVSSRDFVNLRHWAKRANSYIICVCKTEHPSLPNNKKMTRGENGVGCFVMEAVDNPNKCILHWIVNIDLKLWLPSGILDKEMAAMMFKFVKDLRNHISSRTNGIHAEFFAYL